MRRISVAALGALLTAATLVAPRAVAEPEPDPRADTTASYADIGWEGGHFLEWFELFFETFAGDDSDESWLTFTTGPNPTTDPALVERYGHPWIPERRSRFTGSLTWDETNPDAPTDIPVAERVVLEVAHTTALRDLRFEQARSRLKNPTDPAIEANELDAERGYSLVVQHKPGQSYVSHFLVKTGPNGFLQSSCDPGDLEFDLQRLIECPVPGASWPAEAYEAAWPKMSDHWPDPARQLVLPTHATMKPTRLTSRELRDAAGFRVPPRTWRRAADHPWELATRYVSGGRTSAEVTLIRMGDVPAARTELAHAHDHPPTGAVVVRASDTTFTTYATATGVATTYRRAATGIVRATCHRWAANSRAAAIRCSEDVAEAQADKTRPIFRP